MEIPLSEKTTGDLAIEYRIHPAFRIFFLSIAAVMLAASLLYGPVSIPGLLAGLAALFGASYTERWIFRSGKKSVVYHSGPVPFHRKKEWDADEISCLRVSAFMKGEIDQSVTDAFLENMDTKVSRPSLFSFAAESRVRIRLFIDLKDGTVLAVDDSGIRSRQRIASLARRISALTGIPLR